jgi:hypothetical protein
MIAASLDQNNQNRFCSITIKTICHPSAADLFNSASILFISNPEEPSKIVPHPPYKSFVLKNLIKQT